MSETEINAAEARRLPAHKLLCHAGIGDLYKICIGNVLLNIITLGIYSFWGRTRVRKYAASHIMLGDFPFEYSGTGKELFFGFLKAYLIIIVFFMMQAVLSTAHVFLGLAFFLGIIPLMYMAIYMAFRYRLSRLSWRAIRFGLTGKANSFAMQAMGPMAVSLGTLGILLPRLQIHLWSNLMNHAYFGHLPFEYDGDYKKVMKTHLMTYAIAALLFIPGIACFILGSYFSKKPGYEIYGLLIFAGLPLIFLAKIPRFWYKAKLWQEQMRGLRLNGLRFKSTAKGVDFFKFSLVNFLILVFTLGLGYPVIIARRLQFQTKYLVIGGDLNELVTSQAPKAKTGIGDAVMPDVDFSGGMDIGL